MPVPSCSESPIDWQSFRTCPETPTSGDSPSLPCSHEDLRLASCNCRLLFLCWPAKCEGVRAVSNELQTSLGGPITKPNAWHQHANAAEIAQNEPWIHWTGHRHPPSKKILQGTGIHAGLLPNALRWPHGGRDQLR